MATRPSHPSWTRRTGPQEAPAIALCEVVQVGELQGGSRAWAQLGDGPPHGADSLTAALSTSTPAIQQGQRLLEAPWGQGGHPHWAALPNYKWQCHQRWSEAFRVLCFVVCSTRRPGKHGSRHTGGCHGATEAGSRKAPRGGEPFPSPSPAHPLTSQRLEGSAHVLFCSSKVLGGCELTAHKVSTTWAPKALGAHPPESPPPLPILLSFPHFLSCALSTCCMPCHVAAPAFLL